MVESSKGTHRIQGCGATFVSPTAGSPQIDGRIRQPTVIGPDHVQRDTVLDAVKDGLQTLIEWRRPLRSNKETGPKDRKILGQHTTFLTKCPIQGWAKRSLPTPAISTCPPPQNPPLPPPCFGHFFKNL